MCVTSHSLVELGGGVFVLLLKALDALIFPFMDLVVKHFHIHLLQRKMCTTSAAVPSTAIQRSFLRSLIPFRYTGSGVPVEVLRAAFIRHEMLIPRVLGTLEVAPLPPMPRMMFAEGFQMMLGGRHPQREVRAMFEDASLGIRKWLNDDESEEAYNAILRLLGYELLAAASYYFALTSITSAPQDAASIAARSVVTSDLKADRVISAHVVAFEDMERHVETGARPEDPMLDVLAQEMFLLERDAFGKHRFDFRGAKRHIFHHIEVESITKTDKSFSFLKDSIVRSHGNFSMESKIVHQGRWVEHRLWCNNEDTRVDAALPQNEVINLKSDGWAATVRVNYSDPICERMMTTNSSIKAVETMTDIPHVEIFELAVPDRDSTFLERWFRR